MQLRYVGPFTCWLPDAPQLGDIEPQSVVDVPDNVASGLVQQPDNWQPVETAPPADDAEQEPDADAPPAARKRSGR